MKEFHGSIKPIPYHVDIRFFRPADRKQQWPQELYTFQKRPFTGRFFHVAVFHIRKALQQPGKRTGPHQKGQKLFTAQGGSYHFRAYGQTIWDDRVLQGQKRGQAPWNTAATGAFLKQKPALSDWFSSRFHGGSFQRSKVVSKSQPFIYNWIPLSWKNFSMIILTH